MPSAKRSVVTSPFKGVRQRFREARLRACRTEAAYQRRPVDWEGDRCRSLAVEPPPPFAGRAQACKPRPFREQATCHLLTLATP